MINLTVKRKGDKMDKCPNITTRYGVVCCKETERPSGRIKPCLLESGEECQEWNEIQKEWEDDGTTNN